MLVGAVWMSTALVWVNILEDNALLMASTREQGVAVLQINIPESSFSGSQTTLTVP